MAVFYFAFCMLLFYLVLFFSPQRLEKAKRLLEQCHLKNDQEETEQKHLLFKVYLNLALAFNSMTGSSTFAPSAIINCKEALKFQPGNPKVHLQ